MNFFLQRGSICWRNWLRLNSHHLNNFNYKEHVFSFRKAGKCLIFCLFSWVDFILCFRRNINVMDGKLVSSPLGFSCCPLFLYWAKKWCFPPQIFSTRVQVIPDALFRDSWPLELYKIGLWGFKASCFLFYCGFDTTKVRSSIHFCCPHKSWQVLKELCQQTDRRNFCPNLNWTTEQTVDETSVVFSILKRGRKVTLKVRS